MADQENTVSVGSSPQQRRIVNLAHGIDTTDAVNVSQLTDLRFDLHRSLQDVRDAANDVAASAIALVAAPYVPRTLPYPIGRDSYCNQVVNGMPSQGRTEHDGV